MKNILISIGISIMIASLMIISNITFEFIFKGQVNFLKMFDNQTLIVLGLFILSLSVIVHKIKTELYHKERIEDFHEAIDELEALQNRRCNNCKHHSEGKQLDGFGWENCEHNWQCSNIYENNWEPK